jgi:dCTP deaminase
MILSGTEIVKQIELGTIVIDPFDPSKVNPASVDLTLGDEVAVYDRFTTKPELKEGVPYDGSTLQYLPPPEPVWTNEEGYGHDTKTELKVRRYKIDSELGWVLKPGVCYLLHTNERILAHTTVPIIDGKSSIGRLFIQVHMTAGFGDPGFNGQFTLEATSMFPVRIYPGMRICQIRFQAIAGDITSYQKTGNYVGQLASGPIESRAHISAFR